MGCSFMGVWRQYKGLRGEVKLRFRDFVFLKIENFLIFENRLCQPFVLPL